MLPRRSVCVCWHDDALMERADPGGAERRRRARSALTNKNFNRSCARAVFAQRVDGFFFRVLCLSVCECVCGYAVWPSQWGFFFVCHLYICCAVFAVGAPCCTQAA